MPTTADPSFSPLLPPIWIGLLLAVAIALTVRADQFAGVRRTQARWLSAGLRVIGLSGVALALLNPVRPVPDQPASVNRPVYVLLDTSQSMATRDVAGAGFADNGPTSRLEALQRSWLEPGFLERLSAVAPVRILDLTRDLAPLSPDAAQSIRPTAPASPLTSNLRDFLRGTQARDAMAIVALTDAHDTTGRGIDTLVPAGGWPMGLAPLFAVVPGSTARTPDVAVRLTTEHAVVFPRQSTTLHAEVRHAGLPGRTLDAHLFVDGRRVETRRARLTGDDDPLRLTFDVTPEPASPASDVVYRLTVDPLPDEAVAANNTAHAFVQVAEQPIRVVLFEGQPHWDSRFFADALRADPRVALTTVQAIGRHNQVRHHLPSIDGRDPMEAPTLPLPPALDDLLEFDVIVLGRGVERFFTPQAADDLYKAVAEQGRGLVMLRGRPVEMGTPQGAAVWERLDPLSPISWADELVRGAPLELTPEGQAQSPLDLGPLGAEDWLAELPGALATVRRHDDRSLASIWLRQRPLDPDTPAAAAVAHQRVGRGQVLAILSQGLWRWAFLPPDRSGLDAVYPTFWTRTIRKLAQSPDLLPGQSVSLRLSKAHLEPGESLTLTVRTRRAAPAEAPMTLTVVDPAGAEHALPLGSSSESAMEFTPTDPGLFAAVLSAPGHMPERIVRRFEAAAPMIEALDTAARPEAASALAQAAGGDVLPVHEPDALIERLEAGQVTTSAPQRHEPKWRVPILLLIVLPSVAAWWYERRIR